MKTIISTVALTATVVLALTACGNKQEDPQAELQKATEIMQATPAPAPAVQAQPQPTAVAQPAQAAPVAAPAQVMNQAMESYKAGNYEDAVTRLQKLRASTAVTPEQRMALQEAMGSVMTELYARAAKGDARAAQAIKQYEAAQNRR